MKEEMDILDELQEEDGYVRLELASGEIEYGRPLCIAYDLDEEGWETIKMIMFQSYLRPDSESVFYYLEDIKSYSRIKEEDIPPCE